MHNLKNNHRFRDEAQEQELLALLAYTIEEDPVSIDPSKCPSLGELELLDRGVVHSEPQRTSLLEHLAECNHCLQQMKRIRQRRIADDGIREKRSRRQHMVAIGALVAAAVLVIAILAFFRIQDRSPDTSAFVTAIDLRAASTRGKDHTSAPVRAQIRRPAARFRILLPYGAEGSYEVAIVSADTDRKILTRTSGTAQIEDHSVVLAVAADVSALEPGDYELALRKQAGEWEYYPVTLK